MTAQIHNKGVHSLRMKSGSMYTQEASQPYLFTLWRTGITFTWHIYREMSRGYNKTSSEIWPQNKQRPKLNITAPSYYMCICLSYIFHSLHQYVFTWNKLHKGCIINLDKQETHQNKLHLLITNCLYIVTLWLYMMVKLLIWLLLGTLWCN